MRRERSSFVLLLTCALVILATAIVPAADAGRRPSALLLTPQAVVPGPGDPTAAGSFTWSTGRSGLCFKVSVQSLDGFIHRIAIHRGAAGMNGPEVIRLSPSPIGLHQAAGCVAADRTLLREISGSPADFHLVVKTAIYPNGAMRGQLRQ